MGQAASTGRRALVDLVKQCLSQTNAMTALTTDVREAHNTLTEKVAEDVKRLDSRADTLGAWCARLEKAAAIEARRLTLTRSEVAQAHIERHVFTGMTVIQRLRWLLTGAWPKPGTYDEVTAPTTESRAADASVVESTPAEPMRARRLMSAGMAPRPLP